MAVVVVTDSSAYLPAEVAQEHGIRVVPLHVLVGDRTLPEGTDPEHHDLLDGSVSTSAASPGELSDAYSEALAASGGSGVVAVHLSRHLSSTWEAGRQAADSFDGKVRVVDSLGTAFGTGYPALAAARLAARGATLDEVYHEAVEVADRTRCLVMVDRLDYLRRGGRIGTAAAFLGTALAMKPVLHMLDGKLTLREKTRTSTKALDKLVDAAVKMAGDGPAAMAVQHLAAPERAQDVAGRLRSRIPRVQEMFITELGPVLGAHLGPGAVGVVVVPGGAGLDSPEDS